MSISYQEAIAYSFNYASAKPDIGNTDREHILGLCAVLEAVGKERDALAAHVEQCRQVSKRIQGYRLPDSRRSLNMALNAIDELPATSLAQRDAEMQARALDEAAEHTTPAMHKMAEWLRSRARWIRKHGTETGV